MPSFKNWDEAWDDEKKYRNKIKPENMCTFGIKCLDDRLTCILKDDLIAIGADSGKGKSQIVLDIAIHNASKGKQIALFFIEGGARQAIQRIKWKLISKKYYTSYKNGTDMDLRKWLINNVENKKMFEEIEELCKAEFNDKVKDNLQIYDFDSTFNIKDLQLSLGWFKDTDDYVENYLKTGESEIALNVDLIIVDHLQYFDVTDSKNEQQEVTKIVKTCKEITNFYNTPIILVSHLRKKDKERGIPGQEDFFGTSNVPKIASQAITIAPEHSRADHHYGIYPTFFRICKSRTGCETELATLCNFNSRTGEYDNYYEVWTLVQDKPNKLLTGSQLPRWASKENNHQLQLEHVKPEWGKED